MPTLPTLRTSRLLLRPFALQDAPVVQRLAGAPEVAGTTQNIPHPYLDGMAESWIATHATEAARSARLTLAISFAETVVGAISLRLEPGHRRAELGYWIGAPYWGKGYATEASGALLEHGFAQLDLNRIYATHLVRNPASGRVMTKLGMQFEGIHRQHIWKNNQPEDLARYGRLHSDPRPPLPAGYSSVALPRLDGRALLEALLTSWDRHQQVMLNLLRMIPPDRLTARALARSPSVAQMFAHMHHERMISLQENAPEHAGAVPEEEWPEELDPALLEARLVDSGQRVREAVKHRIESGQPLDQDFPHPLQFLQFLVFHESYHHGQMKLALKATGAPLPDQEVGPLIYDVWRAR